MATEEDRGEKEGVEGIKIEKLETNATSPNTSSSTITTSLPSMSSKVLESTTTKTLVLGAPIIASPVRKPDLKVVTTKKITTTTTPKVLALNSEEVEKERKPDSASKLKKKIKFAFKNKSSLRKMRVGGFKGRMVHSTVSLVQESNGSVKAFESFHNVEKVESPSKRWQV